MPPNMQIIYNIHIYMSVHTLNCDNQNTVVEKPNELMPCQALKEAHSLQFDSLVPSRRNNS